MRGYIYICFVLICLSATLSAADPINVRSGAHDGFSRVALDVPAGTEWALENGDGWVRVDVTGHADGFDIARIFDRIDKTHIAGVDAGADSLQIRFACPCAATAFMQGQQMIVLDVSETAAAPAPDSTLAEGFLLRLPTTPPFRFEANTPPVFDIPGDPSANTVFPVSPVTGTATVPGNAIGTAGVDPSSAERLAYAQQKIAQQFSSAATRGILTPRAQPITLPFAQSRPQIDTQIFDSSATELASEELSGGPNAGNLRITSSADIPGETNLSIATTLGIRCVDPSTIAIKDWASSRPFSTQIADLRNTLYSEFDTLDKASAKALAGTYLHFGFGAEARQALFLSEDLATNNPAMLDMAEIMEHGHAGQSSYLHHFAECDSDVALWAILAMPSVDPAQTINTDAALRAVTGLPLHLRDFLAPALSRRLLEYGQPDAAAAALRSLERTAQPLSSNANLAKADLEIAKGDIAQAQDRLAGVVTSNDEQSAEALVKFVVSHLDADAQINPGVATLVEAYALQFRDDPMGAELRRAHVLALGKSGQFDAAFAAMDRVTDRGENSTDYELLSLVFGLLAQNASDIAFLDHAFGQSSTSFGSIKSDVAMNIADRLVDLGFAREAESILLTRPSIPETEQLNFLKARIALSLSRPMEAQALVFGIDSTEADMLRAMAKTQARAFDDAHDLFAELGENESSQQTAWLSDSWADLVAQTEPVFGNVARVAQTQLDTSTDLQGMLSRTNAAIAESAAARTAIADLLRLSSGQTGQDP
jgi:hypothetical protein